MDAPARTEPALGELLSDLSRETGTLVRQEVQLAGAEMREKARTAAKETGAVLAGGALAHAGLLLVLGGLVLLGSAWLPVWAGALLVGGVALIGGLVLVKSGLASLKRFDPTPSQAVEVLREEKAWMKEQFR